MANTDTVEKTARKLQRLFRNESSGEELASRAGLDVTHVIFVYEDDERTEIDLAKYFGGSLPPPCVGRAAAAFGINTSAGNAGTTATGPSGKTTDAPPDLVRDAVEGRIEKFDQGLWQAEGKGGGPRITILRDAIIAYRQSKNAPVDEAAVQGVLAKLEADPDLQKKWMATAEFRAIYEKIRTDRAMAKAGAGSTEGLLD